MERSLMMVAGVSGFLAVALGAFGAHGLKSRLSDLPDFAQRMGWWETAAHYHLVHAVMIAVVALLVDRAPADSGATASAVAGYCFVAGTVIFSGSLYAMTLTGIRVLGAITPIGGLCLIAGWIALFLAAYRG